VPASRDLPSEPLDDRGAAAQVGVTSDELQLRAFRRAVIDDPALQLRLAPIERPDDYTAAACALAQEIGIALTTETVRRALHPDPLGIGRWAAAPVTLDRWPGGGWLPARSVPTGGAPAFDWAWFGTERVVGPFYEDAVRRAASLPFNQMFRTRTSLATLVEGAHSAAEAAPNGLVFHMSRCGSTLVSEMLASVAHHHVVSEPEPLDAVVQWASGASVSSSAGVAAVRAVVAALGRHRSGAVRRFFVKLDSWHTLALPLFRAAFPDVPWLFLYREPLEVVASHARQPGAHTVAGAMPADILGIAGAAELSAEQYCAAALGSVCGAVLDHWQLGGGLLASYDSLATMMAREIPRHFGFIPDPEERAAMRSATARHSKDRMVAFVPDSQSKRHAASPAAAAAVEFYLRPFHARLETLRRTGVEAR